MEAPKIPSMFGFKSKKPDQFYFEPRYYNERKEKMNSRYESIGRQLDNNPTFEKTNTADFKSSIRENWGDSTSRSRAGNKMNTRVIIYVLGLAAIAYYILF
jgi:hypothetical protein